MRRTTPDRALALFFVIAVASCAQTPADPATNVTNPVGVYWLQTDVPRDDDSGFGYPNLRLVTSAVGTTDGVSMIPYVRESRRIRAVTTIRQQDVALELLPSDWVRARMFDDTVGANQYGLDLHVCAAGTQNQVSHHETNPMQVPLGALLPQTMDGLLAGAKDIGTTHITNGGYRVHSSEFVIGRAAGETAALATQLHIQPRAVLSQRAQLRALQWRLVQDGDSLVWWNDVTLDDPLWPALQLSTAVGAFDAFAPQSTSYWSRAARAAISLPLVYRGGSDA